MKKSLCFLFILFSFFGAASTTEAQWAKIYGGSGSDFLTSIQQTLDGEYVAVGHTESFGGGSGQLWVVKLNADGTFVWEYIYEPADYSYARSLWQTTDGSYIVAGSISSLGEYSDDIWILKLNPDGSVAWQKAYIGDESFIVNSIQQTSDGGYVVGGETRSFGTAGNYDVCVMKLDPVGNVIWSRIYGGSQNDHAIFLQQTMDEGFILTGETRSFGGTYDIWILKLNANGTVAWQNTYGDPDGYDTPSYIQQTADSGYILVGTTSGLSAGNDLLILKLNPDGSVAWKKNYDRSIDDRGDFIQQTNDGGYIVAGTTEPSGPGNDDVLVMKLDPSGNVTWAKMYGGSNWEYARTIHEIIGGGYIVGCTTTSFRTNRLDTDWFVLELGEDGNIPDCGIICTTIVSVSDPPILIQATNAIVKDVSVPTTNTNVSPTSTSAVMTNICIPVNPPPKANAGLDQYIFNEVTLNGSQSYDSNGTIEHFEWELRHRENPAHNRSAYGVNPTVLDLEPGFYDVILRAIDDGGAVGVDSNVVAAAGPCDSVPDEDGDGEADNTDICPDTPPGLEVDANGCSLAEYCTAIDASTPEGRKVCERSDWKNDEPLENKGDCEAIKEDKGSSSYLCMPR